MNLTKILFATSIIWVNIFVLNVANCATAQAIKDSSMTTMEEIRHVSLINLSDYDFFISIKKIGPFVLNSHVRHSRGRGANVSQPVSRTLPPMSLMLIPFLEGDLLKNIVVRIWLTKEKKPMDSYAQKSPKKYATFSILPKMLEGLQSISICVEDEKIIEYMHHDFTDGFKCGACGGMFTSEDKNLIVLECGCALHQACFSVCARATECPRCHNLINWHEFQNYPSICDSKFVIGSVAEDIKLLKSRNLTKKILSHLQFSR